MLLHRPGFFQSMSRLSLFSVGMAVIFLVCLWTQKVLVSHHSVLFLIEEVLFVFQTTNIDSCRCNNLIWCNILESIDAFWNCFFLFKFTQYLLHLFLEFLLFNSSHTQQLYLLPKRSLNLYLYPNYYQNTDNLDNPFCFYKIVSFNLKYQKNWIMFRKSFRQNVHFWNCVN